MIPPPGGTSWQDAKLTPRQLVVAELYADGLSRRDMASALGCEPATVKRHIEDIALAIGGPGTLRARVTRYIRGRRDTATREAQRQTPMPWERSA